MLVLSRCWCSQVTGIDFNGRDLVVRPPRYPSDEIKLELGGKWDPKAKGWLLPPTSLNVLTLIDWYGDEILNGAPEDVRALAVEPWGFFRFSDEEREVAELHPSWSTLYDFQREGVEYLFCNPHGSGLCNLSWGLGKGAVATVASDLLDAWRILILAPLTLAPAWRGELERWSAHSRPIKRAVAGDREPGPGVTIANHEVIQETIVRDEDGKILEDDTLRISHIGELLVHVGEGKVKVSERLHRMMEKAFEENVDWTTNKQIVSAWIKAGPKKQAPNGKMVPKRERIVRVRRDYLEIDWDVIIVDESVLLKNRKAVKVDVLGQLRKGKEPHVFLLSGSPITKFTDDLYPQMKVMFPRAFSSYWRFAEFFTVVDKSGWGWTIEGDRASHDPHHYLRDMLWVKSQDEVDLNLPEYIEQHMMVEANPTQRDALDSMLNEWIVELEDAPEDKVEASNWLSRNTRLQQITSNMASLPRRSGGFYPASSAKEDLLVKLIEEDEIETPLLVWSWYVETTTSIVARLEKHFPHLRVAYVIGSHSRELKDETIAAYKAGDYDVLVMQMATGKFGHTFTHTKTVYYHDRAFDSDAWVQSLARVRRIGLKHRPQLIVPKVEASADQLIDANLEGKISNMARLSNVDLARLLRALKR